MFDPSSHQSAPSTPIEGEVVAPSARSQISYSLAGIEHSQAPRWFEISRLPISGVCEILNDLFFPVFGEEHELGQPFCEAMIEELCPFLLKGQTPNELERLRLVEEFHIPLTFKFVTAGHAGAGLLSTWRQVEIGLAEDESDCPFVVIRLANESDAKAGVSPDSLSVRIDWDSCNRGGSRKNIDYYWSLVRNLCATYLHIEREESGWEPSEEVGAQYCYTNSSGEAVAKIRSMAMVPGWVDFPKDPHPSLRPELISLCGVRPRRDLNLKVPELRDRAGQIQNLLDSIESVPTIPFDPKKIVSREELRQLGRRNFPLEGDQTTALIVVEGFLMVVGKESTGNTLLEDLRGLIEYEKRVFELQSQGKGGALCVIEHEAASLTQIAQVFEYVGVGDQARMATLFADFIDGGEIPSAARFFEDLFRTGAGGIPILIKITEQLSMNDLSIRGSEEGQSQHSDFVVVRGVEFGLSFDGCTMQGLTGSLYIGSGFDQNGDPLPESKKGCGLAMQYWGDVSSGCERRDFRAPDELALLKIMSGAETRAALDVKSLSLWRSFVTGPAVTNELLHFEVRPAAQVVRS